MCIRFFRAVMGAGAVLSFLALIVLLCPAGQGSLAEIYKTGKVKFVPEMVIDGRSLPEGVLFVGPVDIALDPSGRIFVLDFQDHNIKTFDASGKFLKVIGRKGQGPGEFSMPLSFAFAKDRLAVWDQSRRDIGLIREAAENQGDS
jgi:hypothetical protein